MAMPPTSLRVPEEVDLWAPASLAGLLLYVLLAGGLAWCGRCAWVRWHGIKLGNSGGLTGDALPRPDIRSSNSAGTEVRPDGDGRSGWVPVLADRLYLLSTPRVPQHDNTAIYLTLNRKLRYLPFCADFGPFNLGTTQHVCAMLARVFRDKSPHLPVVWVCSEDPTEITNAIYLLGAYLCLVHGVTPDEAEDLFLDLDPSCILPFRDATWVRSTFDLTLRDCWEGLLRAVETGLYHFDTFDKNEYFYYDAPCNGEYPCLRRSPPAFSLPIDRFSSTHRPSQTAARRQADRSTGLVQSVSHQATCTKS